MPKFSGKPDAPTTRYHSLRLLGFDYSSLKDLYFITCEADKGRPVCGDIVLAKSIVGLLIDEIRMCPWHVHAYTLLPDHLHAIVSLKDNSPDLSEVEGRFKSLSTRLYWKRAHALFNGSDIHQPPGSVEKSNIGAVQSILNALRQWRAALRPEVVELKNWPRVTREQFRSKVLWRRSFFDHINRNDDDLRETIEYILQNPVKRGYVTQAYYYPFSGIQNPL